MPQPGFSESTRLDVPAEYAFAFLADPSTAHVIDPAVREYKPDSLPMRQGTRNLIRFRMWGIPMRVVSVVREWEQGRRMVMENVKPRPHLPDAAAGSAPTEHGTAASVVDSQRIQ